jgi:membrane protein
MALKETIGKVVARVLRLKPVRVFQQYTTQRGPILASGLAYQAIFAVFAALWVAFSIVGAVIVGTPALLEGLIEFLNTSVPGLIDDGSSNGAIDLDQLTQAGILGWTGAIAAVGLVLTALGWLASGRDAVRTMFGLPAASTNVLLLRLKDLGLAVGFGAAVIASAALSVASTSALGAVFDRLGIDERSLFAVVAARAVGLLIVLVVDTIVLALFFRVVSGIRIPLRMLAQGTIIGAVALGVLKALGSVLLGGATSNPLLAGFAVIIGLLIWFNLTCQVILVSASWIAVSAADAGLDLKGHRKPKKGKDQPTGTRPAL